ncbi:protein NDR1-like [Aristolochia californica]|uniref:protein NDR1-like n=1 Tax=Aristolochia californica TaxID=171875 RepID=UPI0035D7FCA2
MVSFLGAMSESRRIYLWLVEVVLLFGLIGTLLWLSLTPKKPTYTLVGLEILALRNRNATHGSSKSSANISLELEIRNPNKKIGIYYEATHVTLFYGDHGVGQIVIGSFYQRGREIRREKQSVKAEKPFWRAVFRAVSNRTTADLRVDVTTFVKYLTLGLKSKRQKMEADGWVPVGSDGMISGKRKRIKLHYGPNKWKSRYIVEDGH